MKLEVITRRPTSESGTPPLLFVHGAWHGAWCWDEHFLPYFAEHGYEAHAVSLRGHGESETDKSLRLVRIRDYVDDVASVAGGFDAPPVLIGHSIRSSARRNWPVKRSSRKTCPTIWSPHTIVGSRPSRTSRIST